MTPLERAARDRLAQYSGVGFELPPIDLPPDMDSLTIAEIRQLMVEVEKVIREIIAPDLRLLLAALDRHETIADADRDGAQHVRAEYETRRHDTGQCEECACCVASGCHTGPGSTCPTDRLGDPACPCTGD